MTVERDLLKERVDAFLLRLFAAKSEARANPAQRDLYQDSLPLYRQAALLGRFGGDLSRNTLAASMVRVGHAVQPIINLLRDHLLDAELILGDETVIQVLKEAGRSTQSKSYRCFSS
jgi:hypothetical protein